MSRSLPLSREVADAANASDALSPAPRLRGEVEVVDSAMCCSSGLCGPGVDPALLAIARDLRWLEQHGVRVRRIGLATDPAAVAAHPAVAPLLQAFGERALPASIVNGTVLVYGVYPSRADLVAETAAYAADVLATAETASGGLEPEERSLLEEELRSPCTEEIAICRAFARTVAEATDHFVVLDTAPTGHTLLLLDAAESYHGEVARTAGSHTPDAVRVVRREHAPDGDRSTRDGAHPPRNCAGDCAGAAARALVRSPMGRHILPLLSTDRRNCEVTRRR